MHLRWKKRYWDFALKYVLKVPWEGLVPRQQCSQVGLWEGGCLLRALTSWADQFSDGFLA